MAAQTTSEEPDLRQQQTSLTRDLILDALADLIVERGVQDFSIQQVADQAGVSHRTVYRHYPSREALLDALAEWLDDKFRAELGDERQLYKDLVRGVDDCFRTMGTFAHHVQAYVVLMKGTNTLAKRRSTRTDKVRRTVEKGAARHLAPDARRAVSALVRSMISSSSWHTLTTELGLDGATAGRATSWALQTLFDELERGGGPALDEDE